MILQKKIIILKFSESVGMEKASCLIEEAAQTAGFGSQTDFNQKEILRLCEILKEKEGIIKIIAGCLASEALIMNM